MSGAYSFQTRTVELPSDSNFAVAMKTQQEAERAEQQRIKNLVLNYDLRDGEDQDGDTLRPLQPNMNIHRRILGIDKASGGARPDKSSNNRSGQRARKLQLSDVDWYDNRSRNLENVSSSLTYKDAFGNTEPFKLPHQSGEMWPKLAGNDKINANSIL